MFNMEKLILIDGSSILYRAYFALPHFMTKNGEPTGAVYGFIQMLLKILKLEQPKYLAVAFDKKAPTIRHISFTEYKANRQKTPDELLSQFETIKRVLCSFEIKYFELDGFEADDIIASFVEQFKNRVDKIIIISGDMDLLQLVSTNVIMYITKKGVTNIELYDTEKVISELGILPQQVPDLKAISGDISDNIPGIPGIGPKTASKLLQEFKSIENIIQNINQINGGKLSEHKELLIRNKELTTLHKDLPLHVSIDDLLLKDIRNVKSKEILLELEFRSIIKELFFENSVFEYDLHTNKNDKKCIIIFDIDKGIPQKYFLYDGNYFFEFDIGTELFRNKNALDLFKKYIENSNYKKHVNNLKALYKLAKETNSTPKNIGIDINIASFLVNPDESEDGFEFFKKNFQVNHSLFEGREKAEFFYKQVERIEQELKRQNLFYLYENVEKPLSEVLIDIEERGIKIDIGYFKTLEKEIKEELEIIEKRIFSIAGVSFNILSSKQLSEILFEEMGISPTKYVKGNYSTNANSLEEIKDKHPIIPLIIEYRHLSKLLSTYIIPLPRIVSKDDGKLHTTYDIIGTSTGRLKSINPNLQSIPIRGEWGNKIRRGFISSSDEKVLIGADYSQIELRILAHLSEDLTLMKAFEEKLDIHSYTASEIFKVNEKEVTKEMRARAKAINFSVIYGVTPIGLSRQIGCSIEEAQDYINAYFKKYPRVKEFIESVIEQAKLKGETRTILNRRRIIKGFDSKNYATVENAKRLAINSPIQGSAADIIKVSMINLYRELNPKEIFMLLQIHDELIFECEKDKEQEATSKIKEIMENSVKLKVPLVVNVSSGSNLMETKI